MGAYIFKAKNITLANRQRFEAPCLTIRHGLIVDCSTGTNVPETQITNAVHILNDWSVLTGDIQGRYTLYEFLGEMQWKVKWKEQDMFPESRYDHAEEHARRLHPRLVLHVGTDYILLKCRSWHIVGPIDMTVHGVEVLETSTGKEVAFLPRSDPQLCCSMPHRMLVQVDVYRKTGSQRSFLYVTDLTTAKVLNEHPLSGCTCWNSNCVRPGGCVAVSERVVAVACCGRELTCMNIETGVAVASLHGAATLRGHVLSSLQAVFGRALFLLSANGVVYHWTVDKESGLPLEESRTLMSKQKKFTGLTVCDERSVLVSDSQGLVLMKQPSNTQRDWGVSTYRLMWHTETHYDGFAFLGRMNIAFPLPKLLRLLWDCLVKYCPEYLPLVVLHTIMSYVHPF